MSLHTTDDVVHRTYNEIREESWQQLPVNIHQLTYHVFVTKYICHN